MKLKQQVLIMHLNEGKSGREIARVTGINRETVAKYINHYKEKRSQLLAEGDSSVDTQALIDSLTETPSYTVGVRSKRKITKEIEQLIQAHLDENEDKKRKGQHKQVKKPVDIYEVLDANNVDLSYSTVLRTVRMLKQKPKEAFIKAIYTPGDVCEFDWGEVKLTINRKMRTLQMAVFTSAYGNYRYALLFTKQKTECFQEAHALFFQHMGGVYQTLVYDNMRVAVKRFVGREKEPTNGLLQLSIYYGFRFRFCNIRAGNEKAHVERSVEVVRRKAFAFRDTFETLDEANSYLLEVCNNRNKKPQNVYQGESAIERLEQERSYLFTLPPIFDAARTQYSRVDKYSTIVVDQNHYSVPDHLVGRQILVKVYSNQVQGFYESVKVAQHSRLIGCHEW